MKNNKNESVPSTLCTPPTISFFSILTAQSIFATDRNKPVVETNTKASSENNVDNRSHFYDSVHIR